MDWGSFAGFLVWGIKPFTENRRAYFDYEILEKFEAGIALTGQEVKSAKLGRANLTGSHALIKPNSAQLLNTDIPPFQPKNMPLEYDPKRTRQLLLNKKELKYLFGKTQEGLTVIPLSLYNKGRHVKLEIALARHKKKQDKRESIKKREAQREIRRTLNS